MSSNRCCRQSPDVSATETEGGANTMGTDTWVTLSPKPRVGRNQHLLSPQGLAPKLVPNLPLYLAHLLL